MSPQQLAISVPTDKRGAGSSRLLAFLGPAMLVSVGYMDPGNWATDLEGGARFGHQLLWVLVVSNLIALLLQNLSARLGLASGLDLAQACRALYPQPVVFALWALCEISIVACDLAEVIGSAIAMNLLFGIPLIWGAVITAFDVLLILVLQRYGIRRLEAIVTVFVLTIAACFAVELYLAQPVWGEIASGLRPRLTGEGLYIAIGILGAIVMPHNLYLHSALVKTRAVAPDQRAQARALKCNFVDTLLALNFAFLINASILIVSAEVFFRHGMPVNDLREAHRLLTPLVGATLASSLFAVALLCAGQSATITGTMAGQVVMEGFLNLRIPPFVRRVLTRALAVIPAVLVLAIAGEQRSVELLILTQVVLSMQLPFAIVPLIRFTSHEKLMGSFVNGSLVKWLGILCAVPVIVANVWLSIGSLNQWQDRGWVQILTVAYVGLLLYITVVPLSRRAPVLTNRGAMAG
jgi:manganese transport protein